MQDPNESQEPVKDENEARPVAGIWRPVLREIVKSLGQGDYALAKGIQFVAPVSAATVDQIREYIADYGETLDELPDDAWKTSVSQWTGTHWDVLVDLWTVESGESDMVLSVRIFEIDDAFRFEIESVHVP